MSYFPQKLRVVEYNTQLCLFNILHKYKDTLQLLAFRDKQFFFHITLIKILEENVLVMKTQVVIVNYN